MVTVFTPTYNRADKLPRLWNSLKQQSCKSFEWLIVDDGSADATKSVVEEFIEQTTEFPIRYFYKENGGKHRAINYGVQRAAGELFFIVDSDDWLPENSIGTVLKWYQSIEQTEGFAGVAGCKYDSRGHISGTTFTGEYVDATSLERSRNHIRGEKAEVFLTEVLKHYPFPEFDGEKFISESVVWNRIAYDGYKLRWFNENIYIFEYQEDGLTNHLRDNYCRNPIGYLTYVGGEIQYLQIGFLKKMVWCGKCIHTVDTNQVTKPVIRKLLQINTVEYQLARVVFKIYSILR